MKRKRWAFYVPVLTAAGLERLDVAAQMPGVQASASEMPDGIWAARHLSFEAGNDAALRALAPLIRLPGLRIVTPWPQSYVQLPDGTILGEPPAA